MRPSRLAIVVALAAAQAITASAAERPADRSLAEAARASLSEAASQMVHGTRELGLFALSLVGIDYRYGGETPERGLDCSGLIRYVFQEVTGVTLPRTAKELSRLGEKVKPHDLVPGDLVFFNTRRFAYSHVGIYLGDDRFIHAPSRGGEVGVAMLSSSYWQKRYNGARRLVGVLPALVPELIAHAEASVPAPLPAADESAIADAPSAPNEPAAPNEPVSGNETFLPDARPAEPAPPSDAP